MAAGYQVTIVHNPTGFRVVRDMDLPWTDSSEFWWTDGNFGCDCNRRAEFLRALDVPEEFIWADDDRCGSEEFGVILPDGTEHGLPR